MRGAWLLLVGMLLLSGCLGPSGGLGPQETLPILGTPSWSVVALVDTGINPWHEAFLPAAPGSDVPLPASAKVVPRSFMEQIAAEGLAAWDSLEPNQLYWFEGTRVLAISKTQRISPEASVIETAFPPDPHPIYDDINHGTAVASVVARTAPHAWIVMVETNQLSLPGYQWAAEQAWIDVVSSSQGNLGHGPNNFTGGEDEWALASKAVTDAGRLFVAAGGNFPDPNLLEGQSSPPWIISAGGAEADRRGLSPITSQPVDVVANLTWSDLARNSSDTETFTAKGTSFGAPLVAGVLAEALYQVRAEVGHRGPLAEGALVRSGEVSLTNQDFRAALNLSARYWGPEDYEAKVNASTSPVATLYEVTNPALPSLGGTPVGPWVQMGWGYVDGSVTRDVVDVLLGRTAPPEKTDAAAYMDALYAARQQLWNLRQGA